MYVNPMDVTEYKLTMEEVRSSGRSCVLVDDSGTPGQVSSSRYLHPSRKTWVAVLTTPEQFRVIAQQLPRALQELTEQTGAKEFHFTDIYRGAGEFKNVAFEVRFAMFALMGSLFRRYMWPVLVQTFDNADLVSLKGRIKWPPKPGAFNLKMPSDAALLFLAFRVHQFIGENKVEYPGPCYFVLDEGFRPSRRKIALPVMQSAFSQQSIFSADSREFVALQLADFAAFCVGKTQWLMTKPKRSNTDNQFLEIIAGIRTNVLNLPEDVVNLETWSVDQYDRLMDEDRIRQKYQVKE